MHTNCINLHVRCLLAAGRVHLREHCSIGCGAAAVGVFVIVELHLTVNLRILKDGKFCQEEKFVAEGSLGRCSPGKEHHQEINKQTNVPGWDLGPSPPHNYEGRGGGDEKMQKE
jgi:hypothetical protein